MTKIQNSKPYDLVEITNLYENWSWGFELV
jgi:hypothetical protein